MTTVVDRKIAKRYLSMYQENGQQVLFLAFGTGTASSEILDYLGLEHAEKTVVFSVVDEATWVSTKKQLQKKLRIDVPGGGIAYITPLSSIGGRKALNYLLAKDDYQKEEESTLKNTKFKRLTTTCKNFNNVSWKSTTLHIPLLWRIRMKNIKFLNLKPKLPNFVN